MFAGGRSRAFPLLLLVGVLLGASALWMYRRTPSRGGGVASAELSDGSRLVVWKASFGTNHELVIGRFPALDEWRRRYRWIQRWVGSPTESIRAQAKGDSLVVFCSQEEAGESDSWRAEPLWVRALIDQHGCVFEVDQGRMSQSMGGTTIVSQTMTAYPRRAAEFGLGFGLDGGRDQPPEVVVTIQNPRPWRGTEWEPEPLPAVRDISGWTVEYLGFGGSARWPSPRFKVMERGEELPEWEVRELWYHDVTGNRSQSPALCRREPAWKVEARFGRKLESVTAPEECWQVVTLKAPGEAEAIPLNEERVMNGVRVRLETFGGPGVYQFESRGTWQLTQATNLTAGRGRARSTSQSTGPNGIQKIRLTRDKLWAFFAVSGLQPDQRWNLVLVDPTGRPHANSGWSGMGGSAKFCDWGDVSIGAGDEVTLKFIVQRLRTVTFQVAPPPEQ